MKNTSSQNAVFEKLFLSLPCQFMTDIEESCWASPVRESAKFKWHGRKFEGCHYYAIYRLCSHSVGIKDCIVIGVSWFHSLCYGYCWTFWQRVKEGSYLFCVPIIRILKIYISFKFLNLLGYEVLWLWGYKVKLLFSIIYRSYLT